MQQSRHPLMFPRVAASQCIGAAPGICCGTRCDRPVGEHSVTTITPCKVLPPIGSLCYAQWGQVPIRTLHNRMFSRCLLCLLTACFNLESGLSLGLVPDSEDGCNMFLRNVRWLSPNYTLINPRRHNLNGNAVSEQSTTAKVCLKIIRPKDACLTHI